MRTPGPESDDQSRRRSDSEIDISEMRTNLDAADRRASGPTPQEAFDTGRTTLNLDHISDEELDAFFFDEESDEESWLNAPTLTGIALIVIGFVYLMAEMGILSGIALPAMISLLPWLAGVFVVVLGFGLLSRGRSDTRREREAADRSQSRRRSTSSKRASSAKSSSKTSDASAKAESASTFEMPESPTSGTSWNPFGKKRIPLRRSMSDKRIMGVCSGIANYFNIDPTLVRIAFVIGVIVTGGPFILAYIGLGWAMPKDTELSHEERMRIIRDS